MENKEELQRELEILEAKMIEPTFWNDKTQAQARIKKIQELKGVLIGLKLTDLNQKDTILFESEKLNNGLKEKEFIDMMKDFLAVMTKHQIKEKANLLKKRLPQPKLMDIINISY